MVQFSEPVSKVLSARMLPGGGGVGVSVTAYALWLLKANDINNNDITKMEKRNVLGEAALFLCISCPAFLWCGVILCC
jgi:hypothetical protein